MDVIILGFKLEIKIINLFFKDFVYIFIVFKQYFVKVKKETMNKVEQS